MSLIFAFFPLCLCFIYFCSDLCNFFLSTNSAFFLLSLVALGVRLGCLRCFFFLEVGLYCYKAALLELLCHLPWVLGHHVPTVDCFYVSFYFLSDFSLISWLFSSTFLSLHVLVVCTFFFLSLISHLTVL